MISSGGIPSSPEGGNAGMAGWENVLERAGDQWVIQGSELNTKRMQRFAELPALNTQPTARHVSCTTICLQS